MDRHEWLSFGTGYLREAGRKARRDVNAAVDEFRGFSPYDQHAWYIASKNIVNALAWTSGIVADTGWPPDEDVSSPAYFARKLAVYRALADSMIKDLDGYAEAYQREFDVKEPPTKLALVRDRVAAFRDTLDHVIGEAPAELAARLK